MSRRALLTLTLLPDYYAVCRLDPKLPVPDWTSQSEFLSVTRTHDELSIVCAEKAAPADTAGERGWRIFKFEGPLDLSLTGIIASVAEPLADAGVTIFPVATYGTDYLLIKEVQLDAAVHALTAYGHAVRT